MFRIQWDSPRSRRAQPESVSATAKRYAETLEGARNLSSGGDLSFREKCGRK